MYLAFLGELALVLALLYCIASFNKQPAMSWQSSLTCTLALGFIALTASMGASRYLGEQSLVAWHDSASFWAKTVAMPLFSCMMVALWQPNMRWFALPLVVIAISPVAGTPAWLTDVVLVLCWLLLIWQSQPKGDFTLALCSLALVPLFGLIANPNLAMGLFHLALAGHFFALAAAMRWRRRSWQHPSLN